MLRQVLNRNGSSTPSKRDPDVKLIDMANQDDEFSGEAPLAAAKATDTQDEEMHDAYEHLPPPDLSSVITQVSNSDTSPQHAIYTFSTSTSPDQDHGTNKQPSLGQKLKRLFCCFPASHQDYMRQDEGPVVIRPLSVMPRPQHLWAAAEPILGPPSEVDLSRVCLVLDLDETLVHSSFRPIPQPDFIIPVEIEGRIVDVYVLKRPFVDHFMRAVGQRFEVVVFTASLGKYADPLLDLLDTNNVVKWRLFRESCVPWEGSYVKDLAMLGRDLSKVVIVDNSPHSYVFQPENALPVSTFIDDPEDQELLKCLESLLSLAESEDVRQDLEPLAAKRAASFYS